MIMLTKFNTIKRSEHFEAIAINNKLEVETVFDKDSGLRYFIIRNVFKNPDALVELLQKHNAYGGDFEIAVPGYRQMISSLEIPTVSKLYAQLFKEFTNLDTKLSSWYYTTHIHHSDMLCSKQNNMPRFEPYPVATQLCLTKEPKAGLSFFKLVNDGVEMPRYNDEIKNFSQELFDKVFPVYGTKTERDEQPWKNFEGNENWKPYVLEKYQYNTAIVFDPLYFHQVYFDEDKIENVNYTLTSFLDAPIVENPFWSSMEEEEVEKNNLTKTDYSDIL